MESRVILDELEAGELAVEFESREPQEVLRWALTRFHPRLGVASSFQAEDMVILDMAWRINPEVRIFTLDTGRLPQETYDLMDEIQARYGIALEVYFPDTREVERMVKRHGVNLFYRDVELRHLCCEIRKVRPLRRALQGLDAWITGLRREQWASRNNIMKIEIDHDHGGIVKVNPLADWTHDEVWNYIRANNVPSHKLYEKGYTSIGCGPCTRPIKPGEDPRSGRWWWEKDAPKECGIHCSLLTGGFERELEVLLRGEGLT